MLLKAETWVVVMLLWAPCALGEKIADPEARAEHLAVLSAGLAEDPGDITLCLDFSRNAWLQRDHVSALVALERALTDHPGDARLVAEQARQLIGMERSADVIALCRAHLEESPGDTEVEIVMLLAQSRLPGDMRPVADRVRALIEAAHDTNPDLLETMARLQCRFNEIDLAEQTYRDCLEVDPLRPTTLSDMAGLQVTLRHRPDEALTYMLRAAAIHPPSAPWVTIAEYCLMTGQIDGAIDAFDTGIALGQRTASFRVVLANTHLARFEPGRALAVLSAGLAETPDDVELLLTRSEAYFALDDSELGLSDLQRVIDLSPRETRAYWNRVLHHAGQGRFESAVADADAVIRLNPRDEPARRLRRELIEAQQNERAARRVAAMLAPSEPGFDAAMFECRGKLRNNDFLFASVHATVAIAHAEGPRELGSALAQRASIYSVLGWPELAISDFESALAHQPDHVWTLLGLVNLLIHQPGRIQEAERHALRVLELVPDHVGARMALVEIQIATGQFEEAERVLESLPMDDEQAVQVLSMWSLLFEKQGFFGQAADSMAHLDEIGGLTPPGLKRWMTLLKQAGRYAEAEAVGVRLLRQTPREADVWVHVAYLRVILDDFEGAKEFIVRSEELEPHTFLTLRSWSRAMLLAGSDGIDAAMQDIHQLQASNPHHNDIDQAVMWCQLFEGRPEEALEYADRWRGRALPEYVATGDDIPLRYMALRAMGKEERARALLADTGLDQSAGRPAVRAWIRMHEPAPGDYLPAEALDGEQIAWVEQMLPFFLAMEAALASDRDDLHECVAELQSQQFEAGYSNLHLIIAYIMNRRLTAEDG